VIPWDEVGAIATVASLALQLALPLFKKSSSGRPGFFKKI
jgi:hypothetical protein